MTDTVQDIFLEIHQGLSREGPGNDASTRRALQMLPALPERAEILDIGCGPGKQTLELARHLDGSITALDVRQDFLDALIAQAKKLSLRAEIRTVPGSMFELPFKHGEFDLIWSEGSVYIMGFENGLSAWRPFLKQKGVMAASHISWLTSEVPVEARSFWQSAYPEITNIDDNLATIEKSGYTNRGHFVLPAAAWWDDYYVPLEKRLLLLREKYKDDPNAFAIINEELREIDLYRSSSEHYGYVFYLMQRRD
jgi:ubiquinone/menaquinone biosynthesis C-methylase UbiE